MNKAKNNLGYFYQTKEKGHKVNGASKVKSGMKIESYLIFFLNSCTRADSKGCRADSIMACFSCSEQKIIRADSKLEEPTRPE